MYLSPWLVAQTLEPLTPPPSLTEWQRPAAVAATHTFDVNDLRLLVIMGYVKMPTGTQSEYIVMPRSEIRRHELSMYVYAKGKAAPYRFVISGIDVIDDDPSYNQLATYWPTSTSGD
ncbi:MAG: hypothetical protein WD972_02090 [Candidatus Andersenbacteria bacterium]